MPTSPQSRSVASGRLSVAEPGVIAEALSSADKTETQVLDGSRIES
jgi:hypothetical protein